MFLRAKIQEMGKKTLPTDQNVFTVQNVFLDI